MGSKHVVKISLTFEDAKYPYLLDITSLLYDLELLHDLSLLLNENEYRDYKFSRFFWYRNGRPLEDKHRLRALAIVKKSPLTIKLIASIVLCASPAIWMLVQAFEKIANFKLNRKKLRLEVERLQHEVNIASFSEQKAELQIADKLESRDCKAIFDSLIERLQDNSIRIVSIELSSDKTNDENHGQSGNS